MVVYRRKLINEAQVLILMSEIQVESYAVL